MMKKSASIGIICFVLMAVVAGCTLEAAREVGDECPGVSYAYFAKTGKLIRTGSEDADYDIYLRNGVCPPDASHCMTRMDDIGHSMVEQETQQIWYCSDRLETCESDAPPGKIGNTTVCESNSASHCGSQDNNCLDPNKGVQVAECVQGKRGMECQNELCLPGFALIDGECVTGNHCCGTYCKNCSLSSADETVCYTLDYENYDCGAGCPIDGMIQCNGVCVNPDTSLVYCGSEAREDGTCEIRYCPELVDGWRRGECISGTCQVWECKSGYHMVLSSGNGAANVCKPDTIEACGSDETDCTQITHQTKVMCRKGRCEVLSCEEGYFVYDGACVEMNGEHCGAMDNICGMHQHCDADTELCVCDTDYADCDGVCYDLETNDRHCGSCDNACETANADNRCEHAQCVFSCRNGFIQVGNRCEPRICEESEIRCIAPDLEVCRDNAWSFLSSCPAPPLNVADTAHVVCSGEAECGWACNSGLAKCDDGGVDACYNLSSNVDHCGLCETACTVDYAKNSCDDGVCSFTCIDGYAINPEETGCNESECVDGSTSCKNDEDGTGLRKICTVDHWSAPEPCPSNNSCIDAVNCGECINGTRRCSDGEHYQVCASGQWGESEPCAESANSAGSCTGEGVCNSECAYGFFSNGAICCAEVANGQILPTNNEICEFSCNNGFCERDGECVSTDSDMGNCGGCGVVCDIDRIDFATGVTCAGGQCIATECNSNARLENGACTPNSCTNNDVLCTNVNGNIGEVKTCSGGEYHVTKACENVSCNAAKDDCGKCLNDTQQCNGTTSQTCESGAWVDKIVCSAPTNGSATCNKGTCGKACDNLDYPMLCTDKCVNTSNDPNNCSSCGKNVRSQTFQIQRL